MPSFGVQPSSPPVVFYRRSRRWVCVSVCVCVSVWIGACVSVSTHTLTHRRWNLFHFFGGFIFFGLFSILRWPGKKGLLFSLCPFWTLEAIRPHVDSSPLLPLLLLLLLLLLFCYFNSWRCFPFFRKMSLKWRCGTSLTWFSSTVDTCVCVCVCVCVCDLLHTHTLTHTSSLRFAISLSIELARDLDAAA